jgi:signal transduction histidine kinase
MSVSAPARAVSLGPRASSAWPAATAERSVALARGVVFTTALLMMETEPALGLRAFGLVDVLAVIALGYVGASSVLSIIGQERPETQLPLLVTDLVVVTGIIYAQGGLRNEYYLLYYIPILQASVRLNFRDAVAMSILSSGLYTLVEFFGGPEVLVPTSAHLRALTFGASSLFMAVFFGLLSRDARVHLRRSQEMTQLAEALSRKNAELEERTRELAEAQENLLASERLATIGALAASLGHELRNPLGVIRNAAYYLQTQLAGQADEITEMVDLMDSEVRTCDRTIAALLDFARPQQSSPGPILLEELIQTVLVKNPSPKPIAVDLQLEPELPPARADRHQVEQVFANIVSNAYQAMSEGGTLTVRASVDAQDGMIRVAWHDTGPGISREHLERIFDPLFTTKAKGIGLGLVVCKRLAERQGGRLEVESAPGAGATFTVCLPQAGGEPDG